MKKCLKVCAISLVLSLFLSGISFGTENKLLRVISLAPSSTEILFALGLDQEIVGVSQYCNYPKSVHGKERIGTFSQPDIEKIISLKPDIIFCTSLEQAPAVAKLRQLGFKVCVSDPSNLKELFASIKEMGQLVNKEYAANSLIDKMKTGIKSVTDMVASVPESQRPKAYVEFWGNPIMTAGSGSLIDELIAASGGINIASNAKKNYSYFSAEDVIKQNPDVIILCYMQKKNALDTIKSRFGWRDISAVRNGRVYNDVDPDTILRPGPRIVDGLVEMHKRFYPQ
ncbi:MAG: cobalamin-binding protein [Candidatus Omnitrophica bacterium]|nr:cobalamin-binding protein [Candidatus Omnitrophota bacterium]